MTQVLHINDHNLLVQNSKQDDGSIVHKSKGYAWLKDDSVLFDLDSQEFNPEQHCRLAPQQINTRYWQQCAETSIGKNAAGMRHSADLIWKHLTTLKQQGDLEKLALVVPADYRDSHLQLLLGIAKAVGLKITTITSKPVYAASVLGDASLATTHIDVQLHQTVLSTIGNKNGFVTLLDTSINSDVSIHSLQESLLKALQKSFIKNDRFDPLHDAHTEQQLFNQLDEVVEKVILNGKSVVGVQHNGQLYSTTLQLPDLVEALDGLIDLVRSQSGHSIVDLNASFDVSGLSAWSSHHITWSSDPEPLDRALLVNNSGKLVYKSSLPMRADLGNSSDKSEQTGVQSETVRDTKLAETITDSNSFEIRPATHLMQFGLAIPIEEAIISIHNAVLSLSREKSAPASAQSVSLNDLVVVNDESRTTYLANDRLMSPLADGVITAIRVE